VSGDEEICWFHVISFDSFTLFGFLRILGVRVRVVMVWWVMRVGEAMVVVDGVVGMGEDGTVYDFFRGRCGNT
jgi:hypothetical protein